MIKYKFFVLFSLFLFVRSGYAVESVLLIGGGPTPYDSQFSIESNFLWMSKLVDHPHYEEVTFQFTNGKENVPDVRYQLDTKDISTGYMALKRIFGDASPDFSRYRVNLISSDLVAADRQSVLNSLEQSIQTLQADDTLWIIYSGHGGWMSKDKVTLRLWNEEKLTSDEFAKLLSQSHPKAKIHFILPQCHSGGFIDSVLRKLDSMKTKEKSLLNISGFASVDANSIAEG